MKKISEIDPLAKQRVTPSPSQRQKLLENRLQQEKEQGYQQLVELCLLGEYDAANQLAKNNPNWGYKIVAGEVIEKLGNEV
ncbi:hypothetical protein [Oscillatoria salina]|uniref:hypothetical protein n=1 Tax=Oscillatoria salina TaxID=331517 RepID=UPI0013BDCE38|nr:hypothetical protein [Oscillatoria salina]MBZ8179236.1 hypothetical protein [Oscillatoria salina IIICB1]NET89560.1 hypothetical protein [Kamptonema sp. SIO1D9]